MIVQGRLDRDGGVVVQETEKGMRRVPLAKPIDPRKYCVPARSAGSRRNVMIKSIGLLALGATMIAAVPASAAKMSCSSADLQKVNAIMPAIADGPNKTIMVKEMAATNACDSRGGQHCNRCV